MTTVPTPSPRAVPEETPPPLGVVAAVLYVDEEGLAEALAAVERQVYEAQSVVIIGGDATARSVAERHGSDHLPSFLDFVSSLSPEVDAVWILHGDAHPRPDALGALVSELERNDASLVGSKILDGVDPERLESVGSATDVFGEPYSGLDPGEVDLEQYDVVRDVAFVSGVSQLVRRDLLRGLRGIDPTLPPVAAGMDLSQRARIAGGRVMVAPSSEVLHDRRCGHDVEGWRELAGRLRAMLKAYRLVTLAWVIPLGFLVGLVDGLIRLGMGRVGPLRDLGMAVVWNLVHLPSAVASRRALAKVRLFGDEELFRYQVGGSMRIRALGTDLGERLGWVIDEEPGVVEEEQLEQEEARRIGPVVAALVVVAVGLAARRLWLGDPPATGFTLPPADDPLSVLSSYAGGWNPSGLGSPEALHPAPAALALVQLVAGRLAVGVVSAGSMLLGLFGTSRLLRRLGVTGPTRHLAGPVLVLGPFAAVLASGAHWSGLVAAGWLPWAVEAVLSPWPRGIRRRVGTIGLLALATGALALFAPLALLVPLVSALAALPLLPTAGLAAIGRASISVGAGIVAVAAYLADRSLSDLAAAGPAFDAWPSRWLAGGLLLASVASAAAAPDPRWRVAAWGGVQVAIALALGAVPDLGGEAAVARLLLGSLGAAVLVGAALPVDLLRGRAAVAVQAVGSVAATAVVLSTLAAVPSGRAGLPADQWSDRLAFVSSLASEPGPGRVLLVGLPSSLPGESRLGNGYAYRLVWGDRPTLDQAWLPQPRPGDVALADALSRIDRANQVRPGEVLAPFAIRWVVALDEVPFAETLRAQVDMVEVPLAPGLTVFENLAARSRVEAEGTGEWVAERVGAHGPSGDGTVRLADNADPGWGPGWEQDGWANRMSAEAGAVVFEADPVRLALAWAALGMLVAAAAGLAWGRWPR